MSEEQQAEQTREQQAEARYTTVTSANLADFNAERMGLKKENPVIQQEEKQPDDVVEEKQETVVENPDDDEDDEKEQKQEHKSSKLQERFSKLTQQREEARQELQREKQAREALEARLKALEDAGKPQEEAKLDPNAKPDPAAFTDAFEYAEKLAEWSAKQALAQRDKQEKEKAENEARQKIATAWNERVTAAKTEMPDYDEVIASSDVVVSDAVRDAILDSDIGPKLIYHLAENEELAKRIQGMSDSKALRELGKLEAMLEKKPEPEKKEEPAQKPVVSKAPAPIEPIRNGSVMENKINSNGEFTGTPAEYRALRRAGKIK